MPIQLRCTCFVRMICSATLLASVLGMAPPMEAMPISLMPTISPSSLTSGPPLLPPKMTASCPIQRAHLLSVEAKRHRPEQLGHGHAGVADNPARDGLGDGRRGSHRVDDVA